MPWKNGGGETREIAIHPPGAALETFDWRVSMARVALDGPFSSFPEVDRTLAVLDGDGFDLGIESAPPVRLTTLSAPYRFPADVAAVARLVGAPVEDLNVMTRRGRFSQDVAATELDARRLLQAAGGTLLVLCRRGEVEAGAVGLGPRDALVIEGAETIAVAPRGASAQVLLVAIRAA